MSENSVTGVGYTNRWGGSFVDNFSVHDDRQYNRRTFQCPNCHQRIGRPHHTTSTFRCFRCGYSWPNPVTPLGRSRNPVSGHVGSVRTNGVLTTRVSGSGGYLFSDAPEAGYVPGLGRKAGEYAGQAASAFAAGATGGLSTPFNKYIESSFANIGDRIGKWSGSGSYRLGARKRRKSVARRPAYRLSPSTASFGKAGEAIRIRHREYLGDVVAYGTLLTVQKPDGTSTNLGGTSFANSFQIPLNPGLSGSFPWLSNLATSFEEYQWKSLLFQFKSTSANTVSGTNPQIGEVIMATNYNAAATPYANKATMLNQDFATAARITQNAVSGVECAPSKTINRGKLYVRDSQVPAGEDKKTYDLGIFQLFTSGCDATGITVGELYVSYDVLLWKPTETDNQGTQIVPVRSSHTNLLNPTNQYPLGGTIPPWKLNQLGCTVGNNGGQGTTGASQLFFPAGTVGNFQVTLAYIGASTPSVGLPAPVITNGSILTVWNNDTSNISEDNGVTSPLLLVSFICAVGTLQSNNVTVLTFGNGSSGGANTLPTGGTAADLFITSCSQALTA